MLQFYVLLPAEFADLTFDADHHVFLEDAVMAILVTSARSLSMNEKPVDTKRSIKALQNHRGDVRYWPFPAPRLLN